MTFDCSVEAWRNSKQECNAWEVATRSPQHLFVEVFNFSFAFELGQRNSLSRLMIMKSNPIFLAKCAACNAVFSRPELPDQEYGAVMLSTADGKHHAYLTAFDEFPTRLRTLIKSDFWKTLSRLADPIHGSILVLDRPCPECGSTELESWSGAKTGAVDVDLVTFERASKLTDQQLRERIDRELTW